MTVLLRGLEIMEKTRQIDLRAVAYHEENRWFAHCLELDIVADGETPVAAMSNLVDLVRIQIVDACEHASFDTLFRVAPPEIWDMYAQAQAVENDQPKRCELFE